MGRRKAIKNMQLHEIIESMESEYKKWEEEELPPCWDFESMVFIDDMRAVKELKEFFEVFGFDRIPKFKVLFDEIYADRIEQLAERRKFLEYARRLVELSNNGQYVVVSPSGMKYIQKRL